MMCGYRMRGYYVCMLSDESRTAAMHVKEGIMVWKPGLVELRDSLEGIRNAIIVGSSILKIVDSTVRFDSVRCRLRHDRGKIPLPSMPSRSDSLNTLPAW
ncbi:expressed unknown protein [Seminavis robusta]|uniref:Uncharacterized protein n=1 Tax=Seminavis robusta TaxID=568900 RepID=A0A9N8H966_9STRA|nr:expressed unknown protein [Seminavis robusta]|eukprot:Sro109_g054471.1  (100) ;mRNA; r:32820-33119